MLEVLKLHGTISIKVHSMMCLPKLKTLDLSELTYENDESARDLISSCTSLESLFIRRRPSDGIDIFAISSSTLEDLSIENTLELLDYVINAPALQYLDIKNGSISGFLIENSTSLVEVIISDTFSNWHPASCGFSDFNNVVPLFLQGICSTQTLCIEQEIFQSSVLANLIPKFDRLTVLEAQASSCNSRLFQAFIKNSENLKHLTFTKDPSPTQFQEGHALCWRNPVSVPKCLLKSLQTMSFIGLDEFEDELAMVEYILQNGRVMEEMKIEILCVLDDEIKVGLLHKLLKYRRGSERCEITIS